MPGPDHIASIEPTDFKAMTAAIRQVARALGPGGKAPTSSELKTRPIARKSIVARVAIRRGELFSDENLTVKRPGNGLSPGRLWDLIGRPASADYATDDLIVEAVE
jgi:sialic acid synthase SpsE